jgi:hypothetical protein
MDLFRSSSKLEKQRWDLNALGDTFHGMINPKLDAAMHVQRQCV